MSTALLPPGIDLSIRRKKPLLWLNESWRPVQDLKCGPGLSLDHVRDADLRLHRFAPFLEARFPELEPRHGIIESPLLAVDALRVAMNGGTSMTGRWLIKADHALPIAGSIKARGGIYEVLLHAESLALREGILDSGGDRRALASPQARTLFARHSVSVGSTGNLGLSIGIMAAELGFRATVHMSSDAKPWKKARLRARGVEVIEHDGDFGVAVAEGRKRAEEDPSVYFVDDEKSEHLFLGYAVAAIRLRQQLVEQGIEVDARHPLFVYLPCGVGGSPGGITFGLRHLLGDHVHCFFAEPVASPCMLVRLASCGGAPIGVRDVGLDNATEADGLAVGQASEFVAPLMQPLLSGVFTVPDEHLFEDLYLLERSEGLRIEPSAAAGFRGPSWVVRSEAGREYLARQNLTAQMDNATHVLWTTGGSFVPDEEYRRFHDRGRTAVTARSH